MPVKAMRAKLAILLLFFCSAAFAQLNATRAFTETYVCDGIQRNITYRLSDGISGHSPISASQVIIWNVWAGNYVDPRTNARLAVFRDSVGGVSTHGDLLLQLAQGYDQASRGYGRNGFLLTQQDSITFDYVCWGGGSQTTAVWIYYTIP
jgi:hypothetical protein